MGPAKDKDESFTLGLSLSLTHYFIYQTRLYSCIVEPQKYSLHNKEKNVCSFTTQTNNIAQSNIKASPFRGLWGGLFHQRTTYKKCPTNLSNFYSYSIYISMTISKSVEMFLECNVAKKVKNIFCDGKLYTKISEKVVVLGLGAKLSVKYDIVLEKIFKGFLPYMGVMAILVI